MRAVGADSLNLAGFEESQQHDLHPHAHLADFIEEERAVRRQLDEAGLVAVRAGKAAAYVPEELRLEQRIRQTRAIERHETRGRSAGCVSESVGRRPPCRRRSRL